MNISATDWAILGVSFVFFLALAIYINGLCRSVADYLVSGRKIRLWLSLGAGIAGEVGLVSIVGMCEQGFLRGFSFVLIALLSMCITMPLFGIFGFGIERFRATKAISVSQYVEMRYNKNLRLLTGILNSTAGVLQMCIFPIVGAAFIRVLINAPEKTSLLGPSIPSTWIIMGILLACAVIFTFLGGYITLIVANFFQMIIIMAAAVGVLWQAVSHLGLQNMWSKLEDSRGLAGFYPFAADSDAYGFIWFSWLITMSILLQFSYGPYLQRYASMDKPKTVKLSYLISSLFGKGRTILFIALGVAALAMWGTNAPEGIADAEWASMATPAYLAQIVPPILMGILLCGLLWADISTTDQYLLSWSTSIVNDCIVPFCKKPFTPKGHIRAVRITIFFLCILFFGFGITYEPTLPIWEYLWLCANIIGGTGIIVLFGMYWKRANVTGAYAAVIISVSLPVIDLVARRVYLAQDKVWPIKPELTGLGTYLIATAALIFFSLLSNKKTKYWDLGKVVREMNRTENT
ncbi:MAG: sodium:solute symporter [Chthoniobacterales bacterium]